MSTWKTYIMRAHSYAMTDGIRSGLAAYINDLRIRAGLSMEQFAAAAGYKGRSSMQRYTEGHELEPLQPRVAGRLAMALYGKGDPPIGVSDLAPMVNVSMAGTDAISDAAFLKLLNLPNARNPESLSTVTQIAAGRLPIVGSAHASFWMRRAPDLDAAEGWLTIPFVKTAPVDGQYALRVVGPSVNRTAPDGHFAICEKYGNGVSSLPEGKFVHAERERRGEMEWTLKRLKWTASGAILCPDSDHPDHQQPLPMSEDYEDGDETVRIRGIVVGWYKPA